MMCVPAFSLLVVSSCTALGLARSPAAAEEVVVPLPNGGEIALSTRGLLPHGRGRRRDHGLPKGFLLEYQSAQTRSTDFTWDEVTLTLSWIVCRRGTSPKTMFTQLRLLNYAACGSSLQSEPVEYGTNERQHQGGTGSRGLMNWGPRLGFT